MIKGFILLFAGLWLGNATTSLLHLPVPGQVIGMLYLFAYLIIQRNIDIGLEQVSDGLVKNMALLLLVPCAGIMTMAHLFHEEGWRILIIMTLSTLFTMALVAFLLDYLLRKKGISE
jgi:holin-like protein